MCPDLVDSGMFIGKRDGFNCLTHEDVKEIKQTIYNHIQSLLNQCSSAAVSATETASTITLPSQCTSSTITLNESWRKDFGNLKWNSAQGEFDKHEETLV